jgi:hypothetical protein
MGTYDTRGGRDPVDETGEFTRLMRALDRRTIAAYERALVVNDPGFLENPNEDEDFEVGIAIRTAVGTVGERREGSDGTLYRTENKPRWVMPVLVLLCASGAMGGFMAVVMIAWGFTFLS